MYIAQRAKGADSKILESICGEEEKGGVRKKGVLKLPSFAYLCLYILSIYILNILHEIIFCNTIFQLNGQTYRTHGTPTGLDCTEQYQDTFHFFTPSLLTKGEIEVLSTVEIKFAHNSMHGICNSGVTQKKMYRNATHVWCLPSNTCTFFILNRAFNLRVWE